MARIYRGTHIYVNSITKISQETIHYTESSMKALEWITQGYEVESADFDHWTPASVCINGEVVEHDQEDESDEG